MKTARWLVLALMGSGLAASAAAQAGKPAAKKPGGEAEARNNVQGQRDLAASVTALRSAVAQLEARIGSLERAVAQQSVARSLRDPDASVDALRSRLNSVEMTVSSLERNVANLHSSLATMKLQP